MVVAPGAPAAADAIFRPVRTGNAFEETIERLVQAIRLGVVAEDERLPPERELAARLKVSRATLRAAIRALQDAGWVASRRGRYGGTFVTSLALLPRDGELPLPSGGDRLADVLVLRHVLETGAAEAAASRTLPAAGRARVKAQLEATACAGLAGYRRADSRLHLTIAELAESPSLLAAVADVRVRTNDFLDAIPLIERNLVHANAQHAAVVDAILSGDPAAARTAMAEHLEGTAALLRGFLD